MSMYVRVKRLKMTTFLLCDPAENGDKLKDKLSTLLDLEKDKMKLLYDSEAEGRIEIPNDKPISVSGVKNDDIIFLVLLKEGEEGEEPAWEEVYIPEPQPIEDVTEENENEEEMEVENVEDAVEESNE